MHNGKPMVASLEGRPYMVEVKGTGAVDCYNSSQREMIRSGIHNSSATPLGYLRGKKAVGEVNGYTKLGFALNDVRTHVATSSIYKEGRENFGISFRLTPSTIRRAFTLSQPCDSFLQDMARELSLPLKHQHRFVHGAPHGENFVFTGDRYCLTDFADMMPLLDDKYVESTFKQIFNHLMIETPGDKRRNSREFSLAFSEQFGFSEKSMRKTLDRLFEDLIAPKLRTA